MAVGSPRQDGAGASVVWGLKRSGIHLLVGWLHANRGGATMRDLPVKVHAASRSLARRFLSCAS